jgi:hypothetical protein
VAPLVLRVLDREVVIEIRPHAVPAPVVFKSPGPTPARYSGVHAGAAIDVKIGNARLEHGAICALLAPRATDPGPTHLLTCGHVFHPDGSARSVIAASGPGATAVEIGTLKVNLLVPGAGRRLDAALVELTAAGKALAAAGGKGPALVGHMDAQAVFGRDAQSWRPTSGAYSAETTTAGPFTRNCTANLWGSYQVQSVIGTTRRISVDGDSGTILTALDPRIAIGACIGSTGDASFFEPVGRILSALRPTFNLSIWSKK